jgi:hypothetical protein
MREYKKLVDEYYAINEELFHFTEIFYDDISYDIDGYASMYYDKDYSDIDSLRNQVKSFRAILNGMKTMKYQFC